MTQTNQKMYVLTISYYYESKSGIFSTKEKSLEYLKNYLIKWSKELDYTFEELFDNYDFKILEVDVETISDDVVIFDSNDNNQCIDFVRDMI